jgi:hypothetical protein
MMENCRWKWLGHVIKIVNETMILDRVISWPIYPLNIRDEVSRSEAAESRGDWMSKTFFNIFL